MYEHKMGTGTGAGTENENSSGDGDGEGDGNRDGNEDEMGEVGGEAKKSKKQNKSCTRDLGNGEDLGGNRKKMYTRRASPVAADPDNLENSKKAAREAQGTHG